jgi:Transposase DDE domain
MRKGFIKIHVPIDKKIKKMVSMSVTKEDVYDGKMLKELVDSVSQNHFIKKVLVDRYSDYKDNFRYIDRQNI